MFLAQALNVTVTCSEGSANGMWGDLNLSQGTATCGNAHRLYCGDAHYPCSGGEAEHTLLKMWQSAAFPLCNMAFAGRDVQGSSGRVAVTATESPVLQMLPSRGSGMIIAASNSFPFRI